MHQTKENLYTAKHCEKTVLSFTGLAFRLIFLNLFIWIVLVLSTAMFLTRNLQLTSLSLTTGVTIEILKWTWKCFSMFSSIEYFCSNLFVSRKRSSRQGHYYLHLVMCELPIYGLRFSVSGNPTSGTLCCCQLLLKNKWDDIWWTNTRVGVVVFSVEYGH